jgi:hypothetical protein
MSRQKAFPPDAKRSDCPPEWYLALMEAMIPGWWRTKVEAAFVHDFEPFLTPEANAFARGDLPEEPEGPSR